MRRRPIRRAQLIAPFGPGGMMVTPDGTSLLTAGLDHWFDRPSPHRPFDPEEFFFHEWRLERELRVDYFALPPDYREQTWEPWLQDQPNLGIKIPFFRFPQWHVCPLCGTLERFPLELRDQPRCSACEPKSTSKGWKPPVMVQVRFIAMCEDGHIQDFPWREWVHESTAPTCTKPMRLFASGGASLAATRVTCECGMSRTLEGITQADPPGTLHQADGGLHQSEDGPENELSTKLTRALAPSRSYFCEGRRPWLGEDEHFTCSRPLRGSLRGATNVYYAVTRSSIYLPRGDDAASSTLVQLLEQAPLAGDLALLKTVGTSPTPVLLRQLHEALLREFTDAQIASALRLLQSDGETAEPRLESDDTETEFRRPEFAALRETRALPLLQTQPVDMSQYSAEIRRAFGNITLVRKLRETRAFTGFARVFAANDHTLEQRKSMLWRDPPERPNRWLPAYQVFGEGIFMELAEDRLRDWERRDDVIRRARGLDEQYRLVRERRRLPARPVSARLVLVHTLAHLLLNQMIFDCGYSSASLRERLYVSTDPHAPMAGVLLYTAAGDSEGTMGGLVRMGQPGFFEPVVRQAIENAHWCSSDPVCMELGASGGQGPDSCNLAACHNCALVPETSCEQFNRFLDRWMVVGSPDDPDPGFFSLMPMGGQN